MKDVDRDGSSQQASATLLLVNDDPDDLFLWRRALRRLLPAVNLVEVESAAAALDYFAHGAVTAIVTDNRMPMMSGIELVRTIRERDSTVPIIMVSGLPIVEPSARQAGVNAFVAPDKLQEAAREIVRVLTAFQISGHRPSGVPSEFDI